MLELRHMRQFVAVAEELNFRKAALRLHMSQPPLSAAIQRLEELIGAPLFERSRRHVALTKAGELFLGEARRTLAQAERSMVVAKRASAGIAGVLRLSSVASATLSFLPPLLRRFRAEYPAVELILSSASTLRQLEDLRRGDVDVGLIRIPQFDLRGLQVAVLCNEKMALAVPQDHALAGYRRVKIESLAAETFITYPFPEGPGFEGVFVSACQRAGFYPRVAHNAGEMLTKLAMVASGMGLTVIPDCMRAVAMEGVVYLDLMEGKTALQYTLALAYRSKSDNLAIDPLIATARRVAKLPASA